MASMEKKTIAIDDEYYIEVDEYNWTLHLIKPTDQSKKTTKNDTRDVVIGYYANLKNAIKAYVELRNIQNLRELKSLSEYCDFVEKNNKETISKVTKLLKGE